MSSLGLALLAVTPFAAEGCFWTYPRNLPIVETNARYWIGEVTLSLGERAEIDGQFPHARQMSFNIHRRSDNAVIASMTDLDITPEGGSVNPFRPGARRDATQRRYSVVVVADDGAHPAPNTVSLKPPPGTDALALRILYRIYLPDRDHPGGGSSLPVVWKVAADGSRSSLGGDCPDPAGVSPEQTIGQTRIPPAAGVVKDPIEWMVSGVTDGKASGDMLVNRDNAYAYALTDFRRGDVLVLRGRAPLSPRTFDGAPTMTEGQVRYWSLCTYRHPSDRSAACVVDEQIITDAGRSYTVAISTAADRPSNARSECGVTWLDALTEGEGAVLLRHLAPSPSFVNSPVDVAEAGPAGPTLGPYEPVGRYMEREAFEMLGCTDSIERGASADASWDPAVGSFEHAGSDRTSLFAAAAPFAASIGDPSARLTAELPGVWSTAIDSQGRVFVLGGVVADSAGVTPFVSRLAPDQRRELWRTRLPLPEGPDFWNYPGGIGVHHNGFVYAVSATRLAKIDPVGGEVLASVDLPAPNGVADTTYNGFIVLSDGMLVTKSHHRKRDCAVQGFRAFIVCGVDGLPPSALVMVDPADLRIVWAGRAEELIGGRITATRFRGHEYIYLAGVDKVYRMRRSGDQLVKDFGWGPVAYRQGLETGGTAAVGFGDWVVVQTNALPTSAPMRVVAISQSEATRRHDIHPFGAPSTSGWSFMPSKVTTDWEARRVYTSDAYGGFAALDFDPKRGFSVAWRAEQFTGSFISLLGDRASRVLVATDIGTAQPDPYGSPRYPSEQLVWRRAADGSEVGRVRDLPRNFGLTLVPTERGAIYYATGAKGLWYVTPPAR